MFDPSPEPRVFGVPPGADFPRVLAQGLRDRLQGHPPDAMARVEVLVNTARMQARLRDAMIEHGPGFLPRIRLISDLAEGATAPLRARLELAQLIRQLLHSQPDLGPTSAAFSLAESLFSLLDEMQGEGVPLDRLDTLDVSQHSQHWDRSLRFIRLIARFLGPASGPQARLRAAVQRLLAQWDQAPPAHPLIVAGSTGSRGPTALLMHAVARLPQGALVLPGHDVTMPDKVWETLDNPLTAEDHPQFRYVRFRPVRPWATERVAGSARNALISLALRPAPVTDQWLQDGPGLGVLDHATAGLTLIEARTPRHEALAIALCLRDAAVSGKKAALITPDRALARRVTAALDRWHIRPDDSAGRPLSLSAPGRFLRQTAALLGGNASAEALIALLKHPIAHSAADRGTHLRHTRDLELHLRRNTIPYPDAAALSAWAARTEDRAPWSDWLISLIQSLPGEGERPLSDWVGAHQILASGLAAGVTGTGTGELWTEAAGIEARALFDDLAAESDLSGTMLSFDYSALLETLFVGREVRESRESDPRVMIWGTLEARAQGADLVVLGGLTEGTWPAAPRPDPWFNRRMRLEAGLLLPERQIGLSAHDFQQAAGAPEVVLSRATRDAEAETVPSRWLNRLLNLIGGLPAQGGDVALQAMRERGRQWLDLAMTLESDLRQVPAACAQRNPRPAPAPPASARLNTLPVTRFETLIRDPFAIYAERILKLGPLDPLAPQADARLRGTVLHRIPDAYLKLHPPGTPGSIETFFAVAETILTEECPWQATRLHWLARLNRVAGAFVAWNAGLDGTPVLTEEKGALVLAEPPFTLTGQPDRIDRAPDGRLRLYDYKTGTPPSAKQQEHFNKQLVFLSLMAEAGAFKGVAPEAVESAAFIGLGTSFKQVPADVAPEKLDDHRRRLIGLIDRYRDPGQGFTALRAVELERHHGDFDALSRRGEWLPGDAAETVQVGTPMDEATLNQIRATAPHESTWLSANAGSGKTKVLIDRVARLLLNGTPPQRILCLTYTKAAASEMQNRLFKRLGEWAMLSDARLQEALRALDEPPGSTDLLASARRLFARAIETPGGLKIQTIHAFCSSLLRRFPLEAAVSPDFAEADERSLQQLRIDLLDRFARGPEAGAMTALLQRLNEEAFGDLLAEIGRHRDAFSGETPDFHALFGLHPGDSEARLEAEVLQGDEADLFARLVPKLRAGTSMDQKLADTLSQWRGFADLPLLEDRLLTGAKAKVPFSAKTGKHITKDTARTVGPDDLAALDALGERVEGARSRRQGLAAAALVRDLHRFARLWLPAFDAAKAQRGWLDFDDLIRLARRLLSVSDVAQWVLFKLDGGIDHILVDEAQDTSPEQWQVIDQLTQEFTAGQGARDDLRTIFVVGDRKQSIYSFQGADLHGFESTRERFRQRLGDAGQGLSLMELRHSFRSSDAVLRLVDQCFTLDSGGLGGAPEHLAFFPAMAGRVDLWPPVPKTEKPEETPWDQPMDRVSADDPDVVLARAVAAEIRAMIDRGEQIATRDGPRPLHEGDVLILVRRRALLFRALIRACKAQGLAIAGADRLVLGEELAIKDLIALLRFLALPEDDLSLAVALRSPLFGWSEDALFRLAHGRRGYLWESLRADPAHVETRAVLDDLRGQVDFLRPYELIERVLTRHDGRRRIRARFGAEVDEALEAFVDLALSYEEGHVPSLDGFLGWLEASDAEVKRQTESAGRRLRVMTVHGSKGLESPIVILPDTAARKVTNRNTVALAQGVPILRAVAAEATDAQQQADAAEKQLRDEESDRLLYVALTRAEKWLIVCGAGEVEGDGTWYGRVAAAMQALAPVPIASPTGPGLRHAHGDWPAPTRPEAPATPAPRGVDLPPLPVARVAAPPLTPSALGGAKALHGDGDETEVALERGRLIHRLLEELAPLPAADRAARGAQLAADAPEVLAEALAVLNAPALAPVLGGDALVEVALSGTWQGRTMWGIIDRLLIRPDQVLAVDFKSNRQIPATVEQVPEGLLRQMGAYAHLLAPLYPGRRIETALLWTANATLMPLPQAATSAALGRAGLDPELGST